MSISKKIVVSLSFLAIIGGISIAIISVSANGRKNDLQAIAFIQNGDLGGYKTYLINQETNRINSIDQAKFDKIRERYQSAKPLMDMQTKYEPQLKVLAENKDESGFLSLFKQYRDEVKPILEVKKQSITLDKKVRPSKNLNLNQEQKTQLAKNEYQRALRDVAAGREYNLGRNFENRHFEATIQNNDIENEDQSK